MKGEAENTIVRIVIALIVIGVIVTLLYFALGPFRDSVEYNTCKARVEEYCTFHPGDSTLGIDCVTKVNAKASKSGKTLLPTTCS
jgi:hypothetical protein